MTINISPEFFKSLGASGKLAQKLTDENSITNFTKKSKLFWIADNSGLLVLAVIISSGLLLKLLVDNANFGLGTWSVLVTLLATVAILFSLGAINECCTTSHKLLATITDADRCRSALEAVNDSPLAAQWRDHAVAEGRELRIFDFHVMNKLRAEDRNSLRAERSKEMCRKLHNLTA